jgi:hypothetical protein
LGSQPISEMMKLLINIVLLLVTHLALGQLPVPDSVRINRDTTVPRPAQDFPVLSDTTQYVDTMLVRTQTGTDTVVRKRVHSPRQATLRSLIVPGLGQIYNRKYWKVPLVYGAIGFPMYLFFDNRAWYRRSKYALSVATDTNMYNDPVARQNVHPRLRSAVEAKRIGSIVDFRNEVRRDMDYSILFTLLMWGLNVVDATVDAHLKDFDVSEDLSLKVKPTLRNGYGSPGISLVLNFK